MTFVLPPDPNYLAVLMIIGNSIVIFVTGMIFLLLGGKYHIVGVVVAVFAIPFAIYSSNVVDTGVPEHNEAMEELVKTAECNDLPEIAKIKYGWKEEIMEEVILRCMQNEENQEQAKLLLEELQK